MSKLLAVSILHVDDDDDVLAAMKINLHRRGYDVTSVDSGEAALDKLKGRNFDAVLLDIFMPGLSGIELLRRLRRMEPRLPIIMLTGAKGNDELFDSVDAGCDGYLEKPCNPDQLHELIQRCLLEPRFAPK